MRDEWQLAKAVREPTKWQRPLGGSQIGLVLFGLLLPLLALVVELSGHVLGGDRERDLPILAPLPTHWHALLVGLVPLTAFLYLRGWRSDSLRAANGAASMVSLVYSIYFLPILPIGCLAMIFLGIGLLIWSPVCALISMAAVSQELGRGRWFWAGVAAATLSFVLLALPVQLTRLDLQNPTPQGLRRLRLWGQRDEMLRACYKSSAPPGPLFGGLEIPTDQARETYYRVTGCAFEKEPLPASLRFEEPFFDTGTPPLLRLNSSLVEAKLDADAAVGTLQWTMEVANAAQADAEGRAEVILPTGGVVSGVTLWVNGEEREATFAGVGVVKEAYKAVTEAHHDPILVTSAGPSRVDLRFSPVPAGKSIKFKLKITTPLQLNSPAEVDLELPHLTQANFPVNCPTEVNLRSQHGVRAPNLGSEKNLGGLLFLSPNPVVVSAVRDRRDGRFLTEIPALEPASVIVVVDGSEAMGAYAQDVRAAVKALGNSAEVLVAVDGASQPAGLLNSFHGGQDNLPALLDACRTEKTVLWIHAPLLHKFHGTTEPLRQYLIEQRRGRRDSPPWNETVVEVQLGDGTDEVIRELDGLGIERLARHGTLAEDVARWAGGRQDLLATRSSENSDPTTILWAARSLQELTGAQAVLWAKSYHLVSPATGAVVLEKAQDYTDHGLDAPGTHSLVASVLGAPEIDTSSGRAALALALGSLLVVGDRRRKVV